LFVIYCFGNLGWRVFEVDTWNYSFFERSTPTPK
jgi:hypothetical protein